MTQSSLMRHLLKLQASRLGFKIQFKNNKMSSCQQQQQCNDHNHNHNTFNNNVINFSTM